MDTPNEKVELEPTSTEWKSFDSVPAVSFAILKEREAPRIIVSLAIYVAAYYTLRFIGVIVLGQFISSPQNLTLWTQFAGASLLAFCSIAPALFISRVEDTPFAAYGLPFKKGIAAQFWFGVVWGILAITLLLVVMRCLGVFYFGTPVLHGLRALKFAAFWGVLFLIVGFHEDFLFRGYTQFALSQGIGFWPSAVLLSLIFGSLHLENGGESWIGAAGASVFGLFLAFTVRRTGTLWFAIGMHAAWDWGETFLYAVPDSGIVEPGHFLRSSFHGSHWLTGGSVGPEGSVLVFVLIAVMWVVFGRIFPSKKVEARRQKKK